MNKRLSCLILVVATGFSFPSEVLAHEVGAECRIGDDKVHVVVFFEDNSRARKAKIEVYDNKDRLIEKGRTDSQGQWAFPIPQPGKYRVFINAGGEDHSKTLHITVGASAAAPNSQGALPKTEILGEEKASPAHVILIPQNTENASSTEHANRDEAETFRLWSLMLGLGTLALFGIGLIVAAHFWHRSSPPTCLDVFLPQAKVLTPPPVTLTQRRNSCRDETLSL